MQKPEQGSSTEMVGQSPPTTQGPTSLTPAQSRIAAKQERFLAQFQQAERARQGQPTPAAPPRQTLQPADCTSYAEIEARLAQRKAQAADARKTAAAARRQCQIPAQAAPPQEWTEQDVIDTLDRLDAQLERQPIIPPSIEEALAGVYGADEVRVSIRKTADGLAQPERPSADEVLGTEHQVTLKPKRGKGMGTDGAVALFRLLHLLAVYRAERGKHHHSAAQGVFHTSNELLAVQLGKHPKTIALWAGQLQALGLIEAREHYGTHMDQQTGEVQTWVTGTLYAVALQPGHTARLTYGDLHHRHRDLDADRRRGRTAFRYVKQLKALQDSEKNMSQSMTFQEGGVADVQRALWVLKSWAVTPGGGDDLLDPRYSIDPDIFETSMQTVIYQLPVIADEKDADHRRVLVHHAATHIAQLLDDVGSVAYYAGLIWRALRQGWKGLQALATQLARFEVDLREWGNKMRSPAALLNARLYVA